jgi:NifU-like protein involved in Fe-S cluster formation
VNPYSARVREYFAEPAHAGDVAGGVAVLIDEQEVCLQLSASARDDRIDAMRFRARACPHVIAAAEAACTALEGRPVADLIEFSARDLMDNLPVPVEKTGRILVLEDAIRALGQQIAMETGP